MVLFGGAGREGAISALISLGVNISKIITPKVRSVRLSASIQYIARLGLPVIEAGRTELADSLSGSDNAVLLSIGFPYIIPPSLVEQRPLALNVHPTLLPNYRGPTTGAYVLKNNDKIAGSTVHLIDSQVDTGAIVAQSLVQLSPFDTVKSMQRKVYKSEAELILRAIDLLDSGATPIPQDESAASIYPRVLKPEDSIVDASKPLVELINDIRACDPDEYPAYFMHCGEKLCVKLWRPDKLASESDML